MKIGGIYEILNTADGKLYIGSAVSFVSREHDHRRDLKCGKHANSRLQNAWNKYGEAAFTFRPLLICAPKDLLDYEQCFLDVLKPEYNIAKIAGSQLGTKRSVESRARMSAAMMGKGRGPHSPEWVERSAAARRGKKRTLESRRRISISPRRTNVNISYRGHTLPMAEWARLRGLKLTTLHYRLRAGWTIERALDAPTRTYWSRKPGTC